MEKIDHHTVDLMNGTAGILALLIEELSKNNVISKESFSNTLKEVLKVAEGPEPYDMSTGFKFNLLLLQNVIGLLNLELSVSPRWVPSLIEGGRGVKSPPEGDQADLPEQS